MGGIFVVKPFRAQQFTGIYDKGYHTGSEFHKANQFG
jgi:hypothetical protein